MSAPSQANGLCGTGARALKSSAGAADGRRVRVPSIKGSVLTSLIEDITKGVASGEIGEDRLEAGLTPEDRRLLETGVNVATLYPVGFHERCSVLLRDTLGGGRDEYLRERGERTGRRLIEAGLYQQMEYAARASALDEATSRERLAAYAQDLRLFVTLGRSILNFAEWTTALDSDHEDRLMIVVSDAEAYPDSLVWSTQGLIDAMSAAHRLPHLFRHERPQRDLIRFRMTRDL